LRAGKKKTPCAGDAAARQQGVEKSVQEHEPAVAIGVVTETKKDPQWVF